FCDLVGHDCNNDLIPDRCQTDPLLCGGSCLADCDHNFVPDSCQLVGSFSAQSPDLAPLYNSSPQSYLLTTPPAASGNVLLDFSAVADLGGAIENVDINVNGNPVGTVFGPSTGSDCPISPDLETLVVSASAWNAAVAGGDAVINMVPTAAVAHETCPHSH